MGKCTGTKMDHTKLYRSRSFGGLKTSKHGTMTFNLSTEEWLKTLDLEEYDGIFKKYDMMEQLQVESASAGLFIGMLRKICRPCETPKNDTYRDASTLDRAAWRELKKRLSTDWPSGVRDLLYWTEADLQTVGVTNPAHRARLSSNIVFIREKLRRGANPSGPCVNTFSPLSFSPRTPKTPLSSGPPGSPAARFSFRYSTIPEGGVSSVPLSPTTPKMDAQHSSPADLRRELELEFKLPNDDIRSHAWFHGGVTREQAQTLVKADGDFLVRDSISKPGNYVLTVRFRNAPMHFVINKSVPSNHSSYSGFQYQFEKETFDNVPALIRYHIGNRKTISTATKAIITNPMNRTVPLSAMDGRYAISPTNEVYATTNRVITPKKMTLDLTPKLRERSGSIPTVLSPTNVLPPAMGRSESHPTITPASPTPKQFPSPSDMGKKDFQRTGSEPILNQNEMASPKRQILEENKHSGSDGDLIVKASAPPKPVRTPSIHAKPFLEPTDDDVYSEISPTDSPVHVKYSSLKDKDDQEAPSEVKEKLENRKRVKSDTRNSVLDALDATLPLVSSPKIDENEEECAKFLQLLTFENESSFHPESFCTEWFEGENKPLDAGIVAGLRAHFLATSPLTLAKHMTTVDLEVLRVTDTSNNNLPGLELITLPQGSVMRRDILERYRCLKVFCTICILTCPDQEERYRMMEHWISVADSLRGNLGNLFGFGAIMDAMCSSAMLYMKSVWDGLRSHHTSSAVLYDTKLRSLLKALNTGETGAFPLPQTSVPYVVPIAQLLERDWEYLTAQDWTRPLGKGDLESFPVGETWEDSAVNFGLDAMTNHLQNAHLFLHQMDLYRGYAQSKLHKYKTDPKLLDLFRTEFHMRLLWGSKGAVVNSWERHQKFDMIQKVMSSKIEEASRRV